jgi:hypothetical protein
MIGWYLLRAPAGDAVRARLRFRAKADADVVFETAFTPAEAATATVRVPADGAAYVVLPATMDAGVEGGYELAVSADRPFELAAVF